MSRDVFGCSKAPDKVTGIKEQIKVRLGPKSQPQPKPYSQSRNAFLAKATLTQLLLSLPSQEELCLVLAQPLPWLWDKVPRTLRSHTVQQQQHWSCTQLPPRWAPKFPAGCIFSLSILSESCYQWAWPLQARLTSVLELMGNGHALLSLSVKLTADQLRWELLEGEAHGLMDWRTTLRANLHTADKAECWIPQRESSRNYHGTG